MRRVAVLIVVLGLAPHAGFAQTGTAVASRSMSLAERYRGGETLRFDVKFGLLKVGDAAMHVIGTDSVRGEPTVHFRFVLRGGTFFFRLDDRMDSWVGMHDFTSRRFTKDFDEGGRQWSEAYEIFADSGFYREAGVDSALATPVDPLDDTAFFYYVRTLELEPGTRHEFHRYFRPDRNPVVLQVLERDTIDVPAGRFSTIVVQPIIKGRGIFAENKDARMWISDDDRRLIVQMKSRFPFGTITLRLTDVQAGGSGSESASAPR